VTDPIVVSTVTVVLEVDEVTVVRPATSLTLNAPGPQGPRGPSGLPGAAGGTVYLHEQTTPSATWIINHNVGRRVAVILFDDDGNVVQSDIENGTDNQATVTWSQPTTGSALVL
jgi:hypothetical protein